jgi:hypothetical protein
VSTGGSNVADNPFERWFDSGDLRPEFVGLGQEEATARAQREGLSIRAIDLRGTDDVAWSADWRADRVNLLISDGRVLRAAIF